MHMTVNVSLNMPIKYILHDIGQNFYQSHPRIRISAHRLQQRPQDRIFISADHYYEWHPNEQQQSVLILCIESM